MVRMIVTVKLFAGLRERAGWATRELELPDGATIKDVWAELDLGAQPKGLLYALNKGYADRSTGLSDGDELALIPPVSGGAFLLAGGVALVVFNLARSLRHGPVAGDDPWDAFTLEWATTSPPPPGNFVVFPAVRGKRPLWDRKHPDRADPS
jgi:molybdopterin converting factor small subunit